MAVNLSPLHLGLSSCPNDTFIFHALLHGINPIPGHDGLAMLPHHADVEYLNSLARRGIYEITKISLGVIPEITERYALLSAGAALGWGCGPLLVARAPLTEQQMRAGSIAIPGKFTTANLLLDLHGNFEGPRREMNFSAVMDAVAEGSMDMGLIIHEGRFTYAAKGLVKLLDMGEWWEQTFSMPLPLGAIAIRRDVSEAVACAIEKAIAASVEYAWNNPQHSKNYIRAHAQEMDDEVINAHIRTFVTDYSRDLGEQGRAAIKLLTGEALKLRHKKMHERLFL